jgi:hypothetical protein
MARVTIARSTGQDGKTQMWAAGGALIGIAVSGIGLLVGQ